MVDDLTNKRNQIIINCLKAKTTQISYGENYVYQAMWRQAGKHEMEIDKHLRRNQEELSLKFFNLRLL